MPLRPDLQNVVDDIRALYESGVSDTHFRSRLLIVSAITRLDNNLSAALDELIRSVDSLKAELGQLRSHDQARRQLEEQQALNQKYREHLQR